MMNIFAYTPGGASHPPFVSINEEEDGKKITMSVRQGPAEAHVLANIEIPLEELEIMHEKIGSYLLHRLGK